MSHSSNKKHTKSSNKEPIQELIIDSEDTYQDLENVFYLHPSHLNMLQTLSSGQFSSVSIKNTDINDINVHVFKNLFSKVKPGTHIEVILNQPILIFQTCEAKQIEANALYAGFINVSINDITYVDNKTQKKMETLSISFDKPDKKSDEKKVNESDLISNHSDISKSSKKGNKNSKKK